MNKVLLVDDEAGIREMITEFLTMEGYQVLPASNGLEALNLFKKEKPDVAVVDIEMPKMNGLEFSKQVLNLQPNFPIIIISAYVEKYSKEYISQIGLKHILKKPINLQDLAALIQKVIHHK